MKLLVMLVAEIITKVGTNTCIIFILSLAGNECDLYQGFSKPTIRFFQMLIFSSLVLLLGRGQVWISG